MGTKMGTEMGTETDTDNPTENGTADATVATATTVTARSRYCIRLLQTGETYDCSGEESLLQGMARIGKKGIPAGCLNGGCGVCKVAIRSGAVKKTGAMSRAHVSEQDEAQGVALACRVAPAGDVELEVIGCLKKTLLRTPCGANVT
jgi:ferredoxin